MLLITGGTGFIGSHITVDYLSNADDIVLIDNLHNSSHDILSKIQEITGKMPTFEHIDCCDLVQLRSIFQKYEIHEIIHCAGYKAVGESKHEPLKYYQNNLISTLNLIQCVKESGSVKKFIFSSSATVYGIPSILPIPEKHSKSAMSPYGQTKSMIEDILIDCAAVMKQTDFIILRYFNPVGSHPSGLIPEIPAVYPNNLFPAILFTIEGKMPFLKIFRSGNGETPDGTGIRDYIYVCDLARAHILCLNMNCETNVKILNVGCGRGYSTLEVFDEFQRQLGKEIPYEIHPAREGDVPICIADITEWRKHFDWFPETSLQESVRTALFSIYKDK